MSELKCVATAGGLPAPGWLRPPPVVCVHHGVAAVRPSRGLAPAAYSEHVDELADSASWLNDPEELRRLLPAAQIRTTGRSVLAQLRSGGWVDVDGIPSIQPRAVNSMDALADPAFRAAVFGPALNQIPYLLALRRVVRRTLGPRAFSYPA